MNAVQYLLEQAQRCQAEVKAIDRSTFRGVRPMTHAETYRIRDLNLEAEIASRYAKELDRAP